MARKRPNDKEIDQKSIIDLGQGIGLTLMKDSTATVVADWLPTSIPALDHILGGGIPFGRVTEIFGKEASGKCLTKDTLVLTPEGYKTVEDIFEESGNKAVNTTKVVPCEVELINRYGEVETTSHLTFNGKRPIISFKTRTGATQKVTKNHPLLVMSDNGFGTHEWKKSEELKEGDYVVSRRGDKVFGTSSVLSKDEAYVIGMLVADGGYSSTRLSFTNNQENLIKKTEEYFTSLGGVPKKYKKEGTDSYSIHLNSKEIVSNWYQKLGLKPGRAVDKTVPKAILESPEEVQLAFLSGYLECESYLGEQHIEVTSASPVLINQIRVMLKNMGILASVTVKAVKKYSDIYYETLSVYGDNLLDLVNKLEFTTQQRKDSVAVQKEEIPGLGKGSFDIVPNLQGLVRAYYSTTDPELRTRDTHKLVNGMSRAKDSVVRQLVAELLTLLPEGNTSLKELLEVATSPEFFYDVVEEIAELIEEPTFDFVLPKTHSFIAESNINHNSTLAVHLTKQAQLYDVPVIWADIEGTINLDSLESLGVDASKIFLIQPEEGETITIEMVTEKVKVIVDTFGGAGIPAMIIWDSLASTTTEQQMKEGFNPNQLGVVAKSIANMTIQIGQKVNQNNIAFVILNQARDDLKANPNFPQIKSTGGRAMEHWGSLRLEVTKASQIKTKVTDLATGKEKDEYIGHIFRVKTKKSKVSTPNRQAEMFLISAPYIGFDFTENVYRSAVEQYGIISKGAWRKYITDDGEEVNLRDKDWVPFLNSEKGQPVLKELFIKELLTYFPDGFAPLNNQNIMVKDNPYYAEMVKYYEAKKKQAKLDAKEAKEEGKE